MKKNYQNHTITYRPFFFIAGVFIVTWGCAILMEITDYHAHRILFTVLDFMENASPFLFALLLLRRNLSKENFLRQFLLGKPQKADSYILVFALFTAQFLTFYFFRLPGTTFSVQAFIPVFISQFLLGGGLEEGGWRGYLLPCLYQRRQILYSSAAVSIIWVLWHLPYFLISGSMQAQQSFLAYSVIGVLTGFILTAIYLLTKSVLLCMLFHSWQNAIVMTVPADTGNIWFLLAFALLGILSALLCLYGRRKDG